MDVRDPAGIGQAMQAGDSAQLKALSETALPDPIKTYALASYYRSIFQINLSSKYGKRCYEDGLKELPGNVIAAVRCGELLAGNYAIEGRIADWAQAMEAMRDKVYPAVVSRTHETNIILPHFGVIGNRLNMKDFVDFPVEEVNINAEGDIVITRVLASGNKPGRDSFKTAICALSIKCFGPRYYYVKANVNGHSLLGVLDTGTVESVVTPLEAKYLGVRITPSPYYRLTSTQTAHSNTHLGYAESIRIRTTGGHAITLRNVPVMVGGKLPRDVPIVLGLDVLSKLGRISIQENSVVVNPDTLGNQCEEAMHIRSTANGGYTIFFKYSVGGRLQDVVLDTGQNQYLFGTSLATAERASAKTVVIPQVRATGNVEAPFYPARITIGGLANEKDLTIPVFYDYKQTYPYVIGSDILQDYNIFLDFKKGKACLIPRS